MIYKNKEYKNIIKVNEDSVLLIKEDSNIEVTLSDKLDFYDIVKMNIKTLNDTSILIDYIGHKEIKIDINFEISENVKIDIDENRSNDKFKIQEKFSIYDNSIVSHNKWYDIFESRELNLINLNGINAKYTSSFKGIIKEKVKLDIMTYHNYPKTTSDITNNFVTIKDGLLNLNVTSMIYNKMKESKLIQNNYILNQNNSKSNIKPNLLIEEYDVEASHSAYISPFSSELLFYMNSRGISEIEAKKILLKAFLNNEIIDIDKKINKYWR